jgi:membrane-associated phospholipid phosphatase
MRVDRPGRKVTALFLAGLLSTWAIGSPCRELQSEDEAPGGSNISLAKAGKDVKDVLVSPLYWKKNDFLKLSAVLGTGLLLCLADENIRTWVQERRTPGSNDFFGFVTNLGDGGYLCGFMVGLFAAGEVAGNDGLRKTALLSFESFLVSSAFTTVLKFIPGRARPYAGEGSHSFHPFSSRSAYTALPSGHSSAVWSVATIIADRTDSVFVDAACYGLATLTSLSRIHEDKHWASDVLVGSAIGYFTAKKICALNRDPKAPKLSASFDLTGKRQAITLSLSF